ncbi:MAG: hypothetical protein ABH833_01770 [Parcubacteria group bacterium]
MDLRKIRERGKKKPTPAFMADPEKWQLSADDATRMRAEAERGEYGESSDEVLDVLQKITVSASA